MLTAYLTTWANLPNTFLMDKISKTLPGKNLKKYLYVQGDLINNFYFRQYFI
jgi:hypothetical protein